MYNKSTFLFKFFVSVADLQCCIYSFLQDCNLSIVIQSHEVQELKTRSY